MPIRQASIIEIATNTRLTPRTNDDTCFFFFLDFDFVLLFPFTIDQ